MNGAADKLLDDALADAIEKTKHQIPLVADGVCKAHETLHESVELARVGLHVLLLCRQEDRLHQRIADHPVNKITDSLGLGKYKATGKAALILAIVLGVPIGAALGIATYQNYRSDAKAVIVKQEAMQAATEVARSEVKRENRAIDRSEVAALIRDEISTAVQTYIKEHTKP
jgi:hypothetical protein